MKAEKFGNAAQNSQTAPTGEAVLPKDAFLRHYDASLGMEFPRGRQKQTDYFGSAVMKKEVNNTLLRAISTYSKCSFKHV